MKFIILTVLAFIISMNSHGQTPSELLAQGLKFRSEYKIQEGFPIFKKLLEIDSSNLVYLYNASYFYSRVGYNRKTDEEKKEYYKIAESLAKKAIRVDPDNAEAHYSYVLAICRMNEFASNKEKLEVAKTTKSELDLILKLNPHHAGAYQVLGRWHRAATGFNEFEKALINTFFGDVPVGTYEEAISAFKNAIIYEPKYILHMYELAVTYNEMGQKAKAKAWLEKALTIPVSNSDDVNRQKNCAEMLEKLNKNEKFDEKDYDRMEARHRAVR